ncbi:hypothetical protein HN592_05245 [Candidatus Woesearchaeota archaeon]|nr:hypothetical protein [Candidatus Woesearchaeota archaeon]MBT4367791.1 hypothetical protein [Candidatus Woesearchaeota archaeon]MBT4712279.1 hypothetical protein [Candidatus Woesearchaeota archaeon]MBT6638827.1 hypothetical protein [Candidatus Woesearchaeota archaeon]MBT7134471.1 hypothetical protein [Candidatus Woesearchaeota archaeon]
MKKAQVTVFIILMLLILIVFAFLFYIMQQASQSESRTQQQISAEEIIARTNVEQGTEACLNEAAKAALVLLGQQGGWLYKDQIISSPYGPLQVGDATDLELNGNTVEYNSKNYTIWIEKKAQTAYSGKVDADFQTSPNSKIFQPYLYPCLSMNSNPFKPSEQINLSSALVTDCEELYAIDQYMPSFSKLINFPTLCSRNQSVCTPCEVNCENTIQHKLEKVTTKYFEKCFEQLDFPEYTVEIGELNLKSLFTAETVDFETKPKLNVSSKDQVFDLELSTIRSRKFQVKFKALIEMLDSMRDEELQIASFNLSNEIKNYLKGIDGRPFAQDPKIEEPLTPLFYDGHYYKIFSIILDEGDANIDGKPYQFTFVRENRGPVLQYIHSRDYKKANYPTAKIPVTLCSADPDEDPILYDFTINPAVRSDGTPLTYSIGKCTTIDCPCLYIQTITNDFNSGRIYTLRVDVKDAVHNFDPLMNHTDWQQGIRLRLTT